jgi:hypothetical protein
MKAKLISDKICNLIIKHLNNASNEFGISFYEYILSLDRNAEFPEISDLLDYQPDKIGYYTHYRIFLIDKRKL